MEMTREAKIEYYRKQIEHEQTALTMLKAGCKALIGDMLTDESYDEKKIKDMFFIIDGKGCELDYYGKVLQKLEAEQEGKE